MIRVVRKSWQGDRVVALGRAAASAAVLRAAQRVLSISRPLVPIETGALRGSGQAKLAGAGVGGVGAKAKVSYLRPGADGAIITVVQHEKTWFRHPRGGQAKYLEAAVKQYSRDMLSDMAAEFRGVWGGVG